MALDQKFFKKSTTAATGLADQEQGLTAYLDANDVDSYDGDGSIWYDIAGHEVNIPLVSDDTNNLKIHYDPSNTNSYSGSGTTLTNLAGNSLNATVVASRFDNDYDSGLKGYFDISTESEATISIPSGHPLNGDFTLEFWFRWQGTPGSGGHRFINESTDNLGFFYYKNYGWRFYEAGTAHSGYYGGSGGSIQANVWQHKVITFSGTAFKGYLDGNQIHSTTYTRPGSSLGSFNFGTTNITADKPACDIGAIRMYNRALTATEVGQNFRAGNNFSYSSVITSKHEATQSSLITVPATQGTLHTSNLQMNLLGSAYSSGATWTDSSGNSNNGSISGTAGYTNEDGDGDYLTFSPDQTSGAGTSSTTRLTVSSFSALQTATAFTIEFWLKSSTASSDGMIWNVYDSSSSTRKFSLSWNNSKFRWVVYSASGGYNASQDLFSTNTFLANTWYHIAATYNYNTEMKIYVDSVLEGEESSPNLGVNTTTTTQMRIGDRSDGYAVDTQIGQARFYNAALTAAQVKTNYDATKDLYQGATSLQLHLDANGYSSGNWSDTSGKNRHATIYGNTAHTNDNNSDYFTLDGTGDYFTVAHNNIFNLEVDNTIEMWIWRSSTTNEQTLMHKGESWSSGNAWFLNWTSSAGYYFYDYDTGSLTKSGTAAAPLNEWTHLILSWNRGTRKAKMYINGVEPSYHTAPTDGGGSVGATNTDALEIGKEGVTGTGHPAWNGKIAQVRWYKGAMTASQAKTNYDATKALYQNPTLKLHFDASDIDTTANTWTDKVSSLVLTKSGTSSYDAELGDFLQLGGGYYGNDSAAVQVKDSVGDFTVEYFMQHVFDGSYAILGIMQNSSQRGLFLATTSSYILNYNYNLNATSSAGQEISTPTNHLTANKWHHVVFVYDSSANIKFYVDGILKVTTSVASSSSWTTTDGIRIGDMETLSYGSNGKMGYLKMYQGKLSDAQIVQNYLATKSQFPNGHNATIGGSPTWGTNSSPAYNYFGFDSNSEYLSIPDSSDFDLVENQSLEIWVYNDHSGPQHYINKPGSPGGYSWQLYWQSSNHSFQMHNTGNSGITVSAGTNSANTWAHIVLTVGNTQDYKLYLNAGTPGTGTLSGTPSTSTVPVTIGRYYPTSTYGLQGRIGMIKFYGKTLSATEVTTAYNNTKGTYGIT